MLDLSRRMVEVMGAVALAAVSGVSFVGSSLASASFSFSFRAWLVGIHRALGAGSALPRRPAPGFGHNVVGRAPKWAAGLLDAGRWALDWIAVHTGVPVLLVAAVLIVVGYKVLKRGFRFALEVAVVAAALLFANEMGWLRW